MGRVIAAGRWADRQLPERDEVFIDHVAHFVPDMDAAAAALHRLGFRLTPFAEQGNQPAPDEPPIPAGTANRCVMLRRGYIEVLTPTGETPLADQMRAAIRTGIGLHLHCFSSAGPEGRWAALKAGGFEPQPLVALRRTVETPTGASELRFSVCRVRPGTMPEGRVQYVTHHTPDALWQERWLDQPNGATGLTDTLLCAEDPAEAARRYERFTGIAARASDGGWLIQTDRGRLTILDPHRIAARLPGAPLPAPPRFVGYALCTLDLDATRAFLRGNGLAPVEARGSCWLPAPEAVGGLVAFCQDGAPPPWLPS